MTTYTLAYVKSGAEFDTAEAINEIGGMAVAPRKVELIRHKTHHKWIPDEQPVLPNYLFLAITAHQHHAALVARVKFKVALTFDARQWVSIQAFAQRAEMDYQHRMAEIERQEAKGSRRPVICPYVPHEALRLLGGPLIGQMVHFVRVIDGQPHPLIEWEAEMMGQTVKGTVAVNGVDTWAAQ